MKVKGGPLPITTWHLFMSVVQVKRMKCLVAMDSRDSETFRFHFICGV